MKGLATCALAVTLLASASVVSGAVGNGGDEEPRDRTRRPPAFKISDGHDALSAEGAPVDGAEEGGSCAFLIFLRRGRASESSVEWSTRDGTAVAGEDYVASSGAVTLSRNHPQERIVIQTLADDAAEEPEAFFVYLAHSRGARIARGHGVCVIHDDGD